MHYWAERIVYQYDLENQSDASFYLTERLFANSRGCPERMACWASQKTKNPDAMKTWKHLLSNKLLSTAINTTALEVATIKGLGGQNCETYAPCPIDGKSLSKIMNSFTIMTNLKTR